uniref:Scavenger receptor class B member 1 n=1 Tax=Timema cristinae TaxID=61476 RepID=A0A7R9D998_TIMCR|nr:unnamed protein product [Timema cristinae]
MGIALRAQARVQINLAVSQVVDIKQVATFPDIIFPIMWFEDGIDGLPSQVTDLLDLATNAPPIARAALSYGLFALGGILLILAHMFITSSVNVLLLLGLPLIECVDILVCAPQSGSSECKERIPISDKMLGGVPKCGEDHYGYS